MSEQSVIDARKQLDSLNTALSKSFNAKLGMIDLNKLVVKDLLVDEDVSFDNGIKINGLKEVKNAHYKGSIKLNVDEEIELDLLLTGEMVLIDSVTLDDFIKPFSIKIEETLNENDENNQEYFDKMQNSLDIEAILWQNIVLEVPIRIRKDDEDISLEGEGWGLNKKENEEIDPRFAKLAEMYDHERRN